MLLHIRQHYDQAYRDTILHACLHNLAYDRQVEGSRATYMLDIIEATGDFEFYRCAVLDALANLTPDKDDYDIQQVYDLAAHIAIKGNAEAREIIYNKFNSSPALGEFAGADEIIALDGAAGFVYVAERLSRDMLAHGEEFVVGKYRYEVDDRLFFTLEQQIGKDKAEALLDQLRRENPHVLPVLQAIDRWRKPHERRRNPKLFLPYAEIRRTIEEQPKGDGGPGFYSLWGRRAAETDLRQAAEDLLGETDFERLRRYLGIFWNRPFPLEPTSLFALARHQDEYVAAAAIRALENIDSPLVRAFALESIQLDGWTVRVVTLLKGQSFQPEDWSVIEQITQRNLAPEEFHNLGWSIFDVFDQHPAADAVPVLLNLYEYNPCSACRERVVDRLMTLQAVPGWMHEECLYDANLDLREKMRNATQTSE